MLWMLLLGCEVEPDTYDYGMRLPALEFSLYTRDVGVYPDQSILRDPNNPFSSGLDGDTKWDVLEDGPVPGFYAWATMLAREPHGEHQFYTAVQAHNIYDQQLADPEDSVFVRDIAIRGYQVVLDEFPDSVTYDASGRIPYALAPLAFDGIEALGGTVQGGWVRVENADGSVTVVRQGSP